MLTFSKMTITFQSATSSRSLVKFDLNNLFWRNFPKDYKSILGFKQAVGGKVPIIQRTSTGVIGDRNTTIKRVEVRFNFNGLAVIRETNVILSGNIPWEKLYRVLVRIFPEVKQLTFTITNTASRFYLKKIVKIERIYDNYTSRGKNYTMFFDNELPFPRLQIKFKSDNTIASVFVNGTVIAQGKDLTHIEDRVKAVLNEYPNPYGMNVTKTPIPARKNLAKKREKMENARYNTARSWTNTKNGFYVRPGPSKNPKFYKVPKNPSLVRQKVIRAYKNIGVNIPPTVKYLLGISNDIKLKNKVEIRKTVNWNANTPNGMYVRPGPGGLPKLYKIPKLLSQGKKTVMESYKKAGVKIPSKVRQIFTIPESVTSSPLNTKIKGNLSSRGVFRIDGLSCSRYKLEDLQKIAHKLDIAYNRIPKPILCNTIRSKLLSRTPTVEVLPVNFTINGKNYAINVNDRRIKKDGRSRSLNTFKISNLKNFIMKMNAHANITNKSKKNLINILLERKRTKTAINTMFNNFNNSPTPSPSPPKKKSPTPSPSPPKKNYPLNEARRLLGNGFSNLELKNFLDRYLLLPTTSKGAVSKAEYKKLVNYFKHRRNIRKNLEKKPVNRGRMINVPVESL